MARATHGNRERAGRFASSVMESAARERHSDIHQRWTEGGGMEQELEAVRVGEVLAGKYRVERVLGVGGMGGVVAATHLQLDQQVALKFIRREALLNPEIVSRFEREARAAVRLKSEHVARIIDVGRLDTGAPYIVME